MYLENIVREKVAENIGVRSFSFFYEDKKIWVKQPALGEANIWHSILSLSYKITKNPLFVPTIVTNPKESLAYEARRIEELKLSNVSTPEVLVKNKDYLALSDVGKPINYFITSPTYTINRKKEIVENMSLTLANMHNNGIYHSRPALKDITCKNDTISFIDFEENLEKTLTKEQAIIRDSCIYVHALSKSIKDNYIRKVALDTYKANLDEKIINETKSLVQKYSKIFDYTRPFYQFLGRDYIAIYRVLEYFI
ncbi:MAG: hypothetical protein ACK5LP_03200 [Campylobacteraceae bacterium]